MLASPSRTGRRCGSRRRRAWHGGSPGARAELTQLDEAIAGDAAGFVLVALAHVDQLNLAAGEQVGHLTRAVLRFHPASVAAETHTPTLGGARKGETPFSRCCL